MPSATRPMSEPAKKGTRQPQLSITAGERFIVNSLTKPGQEDADS